MEVKMLVLSRKPLQSIMIGPDIKITVVKVERNQVRIGIEAPRELTILRDELVEAGADVTRADHEPLVEVESVSA
jgi:carbon storage regulator